MISREDAFFVIPTLGTYYFAKPFTVRRSP